MKSNRRSILIGLGALTVGGGAVFGTGAFSSVEADRTVTVNTTGDSGALLAFSEPEGYEGFDLQDTDSAVTLAFSQLNEDADTSFNGALRLDNNGSQEVTVSIEGTPTNLDATVDGDSTLGTADADNVTISFTVRLTDGDASSAMDDPLTIRAE